MIGLRSLSHFFKSEDRTQGTHRIHVHHHYTHPKALKASGWGHVSQALGLLGSGKDTTQVPGEILSQSLAGIIAEVGIHISNKEPRGVSEVKATKHISGRIGIPTHTVLVGMC